MTIMYLLSLKRFLCVSSFYFEYLCAIIMVFIYLRTICLPPPPGRLESSLSIIIYWFRDLFFPIHLSVETLEGELHWIPGHRRGWSSLHKFQL